MHNGYLAGDKSVSALFVPGNTMVNQLLTGIGDE